MSRTGTKNNADSNSQMIHSNGEIRNTPGALDPVEQNHISLNRPTRVEEMADDPGKMHRLVEAFSSCRLGQMVLMRLLRLLHQLELVVQWSVPDSERTKCATGSINTYIAPKPVRPLPWALMVPAIAGVRSYAMCEKAFRLMLGKPTLQIWHMAVRLQFWQRELRAVRNAGSKEISVRDEQVVQGCAQILGHHAVEAQPEAQPEASPNAAAEPAAEQTDSEIEEPQADAVCERGDISRHNDSIGDLVTKEYRSDGESSDSSFVAPSSSGTDYTLDDSVTDSDGERWSSRVNAMMLPAPDCDHSWCRESYSIYAENANGALQGACTRRQTQIPNHDCNSCASQLNQRTTTEPSTINLSFCNVQITCSSSKPENTDSGTNNTCIVESMDAAETNNKPTSTTLNSDLADVAKELHKEEENSGNPEPTTRELLPGTPDTPKVTLTESHDPISPDSSDEQSSFLRSIENTANRSSTAEVHEEQLDGHANSEQKLSKNKRRRLKKKENKKKQMELSQQELADEDGENKEN